MPKSLGREIGLLRKLVTHLEQRLLPFEEVTQTFLRREGLGHVREKGDGSIAIRTPGYHAFTELTDCLLDRLPDMERGAIHADIQDELFSFIEDYVGREPLAVGSQEAEALVGHFEKWFAVQTSPRRVFVPCVISRTPASRFEIGPVTFEFIERVATSDFCPHGSGEAALDRHGFDDLLRWMRERDADWLARVSVDGCQRKRADEIAELAVDLVIVALQLAAPYLDTRTMARLDARRGTSQKRTLSEANGYHHAGWTRKEPGLAIGHGTLPGILQKAAPVFTAVGNVVRSFASGSFRLPVLERAWCDAAYWLHQALAESIDAIAIAKLETSLEVLLRTESSKGSKPRRGGDPGTGKQTLHSIASQPCVCAAISRRWTTFVEIHPRERASRKSSGASSAISPARSSDISAGRPRRGSCLPTPLDRYRSINALAETINDLFKAEVIHRRGPWRSAESVEFAAGEWVDWFSNRRLLEPIGNIPPAEAEAEAEAEARYYA